MAKQKPESSRRRSFLLAAGAGSAGAVVAAGMGAVGVGRTPDAPKAVSVEEKAAGYEETRHISNYYRTARI